MSTNENEVKRSYQAYLDKPTNEASIEEWLAWSISIQKILNKKEVENKKMRHKFKKIKEALTKKDIAILHYKSLIKEFELKIEKHESMFLSKICNNICGFFKTK